MNRPLRILVVDDEVLIADHIAYTLECAGHTVVAMAPSGEKALQALSGTAVDIAVVDIKLKGAMNGIDLGHELRAGGIPHVFISGSGDPATLAAAQTTSPCGFLQKPFDERELLAVVENSAGKC